MRDFTSVDINGTRYEVPGNFGVVDNVVVIDCDELKGLFEFWCSDNVTLKNLKFYRFNEVIESYRGEFIVDAVRGNEAEFYKTR